MVLVGLDGQPIDPNAAMREMMEQEARHQLASWDNTKKKLPQDSAVHRLMEIAAENIAVTEKMNKAEMIIVLVQRVQGYLNAGIETDISQMNKMMEVPCHDIPTSPTLERLLQFEVILKKECKELDDIIELARQRETMEDGQEKERVSLQLYVMFLDLLADLCVFCFSESQRTGMRLSNILHLVMCSNFTKLPSDGKPIWIDGKFQKGDRYMPPELAIEQCVKSSIRSRECGDSESSDTEQKV